MNTFDRFTCKKSRVWLSIVAVVSVAAFVSVFSAIFHYKLISYELLVNCIICAWFVAVFICTFIVIYERREYDTYGRYWSAFAFALGISNGFLAGLVGRTLLLITDDFGGLIRQTLFTPFIAAIFAGVASYIAMSILEKLNQSRFLSYITFFYVTGVISASINTHLYDWWKSSICTLGMPWRSNSDIYNSTLMIIGLLMALFIVYMIPQFKILLRKKMISRPKVIIILILFIFEILSIMSVGVFPFGINHTVESIHVFFGFYVFCNAGVFMALSGWLFSSFPKKYILINYSLLFLAVILYAVGYYLCFIIKIEEIPFTLIELITAIIILIWLLVTLNRIKLLSTMSFESR